MFSFRCCFNLKHWMPSSDVIDHHVNAFGMTFRDGVTSEIFDRLL